MAANGAVRLFCRSGPWPRMVRWPIARYVPSGVQGALLHYISLPMPKKFCCFFDHGFLKIRDCGDFLKPKKRHCTIAERPPFGMQQDLPYYDGHLSASANLQ